jgi:AbrB family looped-hinge helix DNA binding protein
MATLRIDSKGRLTLPRDIRDELELEPGDSVFYSREGNVLKIAKARNPFDVLGDEAVSEHHAGRTRPLREYARERAKG